MGKRSYASRLMSRRKEDFFDVPGSEPSYPPYTTVLKIWGTLLLLAASEILKDPLQACMVITLAALLPPECESQRNPAQAKQQTKPGVNRARF
jgi:hypothetical protein